MSEIKQLDSNINITNNWQKTCAAEDWSKPEFKYVLENIFTGNASYHRKQWEFVAIFINLIQQGKLDGNSVGASFGAGKEPLIYHVLPYVKSFLATDLYSWNTGWDTAKMNPNEQPIDFLKRNAPKNSRLDNLKAQEMDMRDLSEIESNSLDFCYSSCAVEHIGHKEDFIKHLTEVKRVLKKDGVYVMTTEFLYNHSTIPNKGNYKFDIDYLKQLFIESGLNTQPIFDAGCEENRLNVPRAFVRPLVGGKNMEKLLASAAILDIEGVPYTSCCFVLSPSEESTPSSFQVNGLEQSAEFIKKRLLNNVKNLYSSRRNLDPFYSLNKKTRLYLDDHITFRTNESNKNPIKLDRANFCFTDFVYFGAGNVSISINYKLEKHKGRINLKVVEKYPMEIKQKTELFTKFIKHSVKTDSQTIQFNFKADPEKVYAIIGQIAPKEMRKNDIKLNLTSLSVTALMKPVD